jgi:tetratricopeptide (TPR) repeat protein
VRRALAVTAVILACLGAASPSQAQTAAERSLAREQFQEGVAAAREGNWAGALDAFQRSYELLPRPLTLLNLAGAYAQMGQLVEAAEAYRMFLHEDDVTDRQRRDAEEQLAALEPRIPRVRLRVLGLEEGDVVLLDEYQLSVAALDEAYPVNPGEHTATIERAAHEPRVVPFTATEAVQQDVLIDVRAESWPAIVVADGGEDGEGDGGEDGEDERPAGGTSIAEEPAFWIVIGSVLVAGAVAVGLGVGLSTPPEPYAGNTYPFRVELP